MDNLPARPTYRKRIAFISLAFFLLCLALTVYWVIMHTQNILVTLKLNQRFRSAKDGYSELMEVFAHNQDFIDVIIPMLVGFFFSLILLALFLHLRYGWLSRWGMSFLAAGLLSINIVSICFISALYPVNTEMDLLIDSPQDLQGFEKMMWEKSNKDKIGSPIFVPTGVFIESFEYSNAFDVTINAYIWQRYTKGVHDSIQRGFVLPEVQSLTMTEAYRSTNGNTETVGWLVQAVMREAFDYERYPFDVQDLWVRIMHKDFDKNVVLIPDFKAYPSIAPNQKPGIERHIAIPSWNMFASSFGYKYNRYDTTLGIDNFVGLSDYPELHFGVYLEREFLSVFISNLMPIILVTIILFVTRVIMGVESSRRGEFFTFNFLELLAIFATLLFVIILSQIELRDKIPSSGILYIEYYYFVVYLAIFIVMSEYYIYMRGRKPWGIEGRKALLDKTLFLPLFCLCVLIVTVKVFS